MFDSLFFEVHSYKKDSLLVKVIPSVKRDLIFKSYLIFQFFHDIRSIFEGSQGLGHTIKNNILHSIRIKIQF